MRKLSCCNFNVSRWSKRRPIRLKRSSRITSKGRRPFSDRSNSKRSQPYSNASNEIAMSN